MLEREKFDFWSEQGLLDGLSETEALATAVMLDSVATYIDRNSGFLNYYLPYIAIPCASKIFKKTKVFFNVSDFIQNLNNLLLRIQGVDNHYFEKDEEYGDFDENVENNLRKIGETINMENLFNSSEIEMSEQDELNLEIIKDFCRSIEKSLLN
jgi:hypothetical protein